MEKPQWAILDRWRCAELVLVSRDAANLQPDVADID